MDHAPVAVFLHEDYGLFAAEVEILAVRASRLGKVIGQHGRFADHLNLRVQHLQGVDLSEVQERL